MFGLAAYIFTEYLRRAVIISENPEHGIIGLNVGLPSVPQAPFGVFKENGIGREGGHHGIEEFLDVKYISIQFKRNPNYIICYLLNMEHLLVVI